MTRRTNVNCTYQFSADEAISCTVSIPANYPDAVAEAKATVLGMMHDELADVIAQNHTASKD